MFRGLVLLHTMAAHKLVDRVMKLLPNGAFIVYPLQLVYVVARSHSRSATQILFLHFLFYGGGARHCVTELPSLLRRYLPVADLKVVQVSHAGEQSAK